jgi:hypothetical protein
MTNTFDIKRLLLLAGLLTILLCAAALALSAEKPHGIRADFTAKLDMGGGADSAVKFNGDLAWDEPKLRVNFSDETTKEANILLVDFTAKTAVLLYPDTLNGTSSDLAHFDKSGHLSRLRDMLNSKPPQTPDGWTKKDLGKEKLGKVQCTHVRFSSPEGQSVDIWSNAKNQPVRMILNKKSITITLDVTKINEQQTIPADTFTYDKSYTISEYKSGQDQRLPSV